MKTLIVAAALTCWSAHAFAAQETAEAADEFGTTANLIKECSPQGKSGSPSKDCKAMFEMTLQAMAYAEDLLKTGQIDAATPQDRMRIRHLSASYDCQKGTDISQAIPVVIERIKARGYRDNAPALVDIVNSFAEGPVCAKTPG